jgi:hypothetical protein
MKSTLGVESEGVESEENPLPSPIVNLWGRRVLPTDYCVMTNGWFVWLPVAAASVARCRSVAAVVQDRAWISGS